MPSFQLLPSHPFKSIPSILTPFFPLQLPSLSPSQIPFPQIVLPLTPDRTKYMRQTFHSLTTEINSLAKIKFECDAIAHQHTKHVALGGFAALVVYWGTIYYLTFQKYGWDIMEPITYLTGLGGAMGMCPFLLYRYNTFSP
jgi:hypothetical protein